MSRGIKALDIARITSVKEKKNLRLFTDIIHKYSRILYKYPFLEKLYIFFIFKTDVAYKDFTFVIKRVLTFCPAIIVLLVIMCLDA